MSSATLQHAVFILRGNPVTGLAAIGAAVLIFVVVNLTVDVLYGIADPRVSVE
ncbi:MAG: hypothetical protein ABWY10_14010 [Tardiphaga sp.]